jgi:hypothetical protein
MNLRRRASLRTVAAACGIVAAVLMVALPSFLAAHPSRPVLPLAADLTAIDPQSLVPAVADLPVGTLEESHAYVTTTQAARINGTSLALLQQTGREIGFDRDFKVPRFGDVEVEVVRFRTHAGMSRAYSYFLTLASAQGLPNPSRLDGIGERGAVVVTPEAAFIEFMRGRYYTVVTTVPGGRENVDLIGRVSHKVDQRILRYGARA